MINFITQDSSTTLNNNTVLLLCYSDLVIIFLIQTSKIFLLKTNLKSILIRAELVLVYLNIHPYFKN